MKPWSQCILWILCLGCVRASAQDIRLSVVRVGAHLRIEFSTESGKLYGLESSMNLRAWSPTTWSRAGDGQMSVYEVSPGEDAARFFRLAVRDSGAGLAPAPAAMAEALVGVTWQGYRFQTTNRFDWQGEKGNWSYEKTGPDKGVLAFTYDEDGNNAALYREEVILEFKTASTGNYRYSEYVRGVEDQGSVSSGAMELTFLLDLAPAAEAMAARLLGRTWEGYVFTGPTRFDWETPGHSGDWRYEKTGRQTGLLVFTYDKDNNDPGLYREEMTLTFRLEDRGTALYSEYVNGVKRASRDRLFAFRLPQLPGP